MTSDRLKAWMSANAWALALMAVIIAGYTIGKDRALRDNAIDRPILTTKGA